MKQLAPAIRSTLLGIFAVLPVALAVPQGFQDPSKLTVVDCLLPGQVRKLGGQMTYLTPPRPARTTASVCEIRGGEYVAFDRANLKTALAVWQPLANEGDAAAQAYVAEMYEKGLGTSPDYVAAAEWYDKAAAQGNQRAQLSLAYLYEQGLGVERDPLKALNLYRDATGIEDDGLTYVSELTAARSEAQRIIDSLVGQLETQNETIESLQGQLAFTQSKLEERRSQLRTARLQAESLQTELAELQRTVASPQRMLELERLAVDVKEKEQQLAWRQREVADLEAQSARQRSELSRSLQDADSRGAQLEARLDPSSATDPAMDALRQQLMTSQSALRATEQRVAELTGALARERAQIATDREQLIRTAGITSEQQQRELVAREARLLEQETSIAALQAEQRNHLAIISDLRGQQRAQEEKAQTQQTEIQVIRAELVGTQQRLLETDQHAADVSAQLREERERIRLEREQIDSRRAVMDDTQRRQIEELSRQVAAREAKLLEQAALLESLERESQAYVQQIAQLRSQEQQPIMAMRSIGATASQVEITPTARMAKDLGLGTYHALIIGNNNYEHMPRLDTALNDAEALDKVLRERYGFRTRVLRNATRADILGALNDYLASKGEFALKADDSLLIYYAGHGELDQRNLVGYWLPVNADRSDNTEWISDQTITNLISLMPAKHVLVIADSCYSGAMTRNSGVRIVTTGAEETLELRRLKKLAQLPSRTVLTSGDNQPVLDGGGGTHSIFAKYLIETLQANEQVLDGSALYDALFDPVQDAAAQFRVNQSPRYSALADAGHLNGEFLFVPQT